jgi:hypothetical protein
MLTLGVIHPNFWAQNLDNLMIFIDDWLLSMLFIKMTIKESFQQHPIFSDLTRVTNNESFLKEFFDVNLMSWLWAKISSSTPLS